MPDARRNNAITERIARWFDHAARDLPWRATDRRGKRNPYHALVAETMLQQTQVARVIEKYDAFLTRFPTVESLAKAKDEHVLAAWSGLGYYRRARHLHRAAKEIVERHGGAIPNDISALRELSGVGRYTAGAIASIVFDEPAPIVDGNVARVLLRIEGCELHPASTEGSHWLWDRAETLACRAANRLPRGAARFNEGMMELGATICAPRSPNCAACPVATLCRAKRTNQIASIPPPKKTVRTAVVHHDCVLITDPRGRRLVQRRPDVGLWAGLWQPPTLEGNGKAPTKNAVETWLGAPVARAGAFDFQTSHRLVRFRVWRPRNAGAAPSPPGQWRTPRQIERLALSNPHRRILLEM